MAKYDLCRHTECKKKYQCKRYCTPVEGGQEKIDLKEQCNESNNFDLYIDWRTGNTKDD
jgi:translation initiation factor RLI1